MMIFSVACLPVALEMVSLAKYAFTLTVRPNQPCTVCVINRVTSIECMGYIKILFLTLTEETT